MHVIEVDEHNRIKTVNGLPKPHITDVLKDLELSKNFEGIDPWYAERGKAVHLAVRFLNEKRLKTESLDEEIKPFIESYQKWLTVSGFTPEVWEVPLYSELHDFVTTLDLIGTLNGERILIDLKTSSSLDPAVELQTAGQQIAWEENNRLKPIAKRFALKLMSDGTVAKLKDCTDVNVYLFLDALKVWRWKMSHKRVKKISTHSVTDVKKNEEAIA
jgi:hypothetical protein